MRAEREPEAEAIGGDAGARREAGPSAEDGAGREGDVASPLILCTNDDGVHARGLSVLFDVAAGLGRARVVAPDRQQSASSHSLTLHRPLRTTRVDEARTVVDGTPTDCVLLAVRELLGAAPDFVFSGVNHGSNMGEDVLYSGTVAAAMEATILGIPAVAISFVGDDAERIVTYGDFLAELLGGLVGRDDFPSETFFNVNIPDRNAGEVEGVRVTTLGRRVYADSLVRRQDPHGREYFWIGGGRSQWSGREDSDFRAIQAGFVSVTPLHLDLTNFPLVEEVRSWPLEPT